MQRQHRPIPHDACVAAARAATPDDHRARRAGGLHLGSRQPPRVGCARGPRDWEHPTCERGTVSGDPDTSVTREDAKTRAAHHSFAADRALHTQALTCMRNSNQQHTQILAAQVLSSSCRHSGCVLQSLRIPWRIQGRAVADGQYVQLLRLRQGVPYVMPPAQWRCNCASHGGQHHSTAPTWRALLNTQPRPTRTIPSSDSVLRHRPVPRPVLQAPLEKGDEAARQHP
jgi:hypothetical protein